MKISKLELEKKEIDYILYMIWKGKYEIWKGKYEIPLELVLSPFNLSLDLVVNIVVDNTGVADIDPCIDNSKHTYVITSIETIFCIDSQPVDYIEIDTCKLISELNDKL